MAFIKTGPLAGFHAPDYDGGSIVNLLASIVHWGGGDSPHQGLAGFSLDNKQIKRVVYLILDGLGAEQLQDFLERRSRTRFFGRHDWRTITTVWPATTAAAVTTFGTGATPAEHGILGWHLNLPDLGLVSSILPCVTRTGVPIAGDWFNLNDYLRLPSYLNSTKASRELITRNFIVASRYSLCGTHWQRRAGYASWGGLERQVMRFARRRGRRLAYVYWPYYDTLCHEHGCFHKNTLKHLGELDRGLARLAQRLEGSGTLLAVLADHGLVDAAPGHRVDLADIPGFLDCLATMPSGDARQVMCFVRPGRVKQFRQLVAGPLRKACVCLTAEELLRSGVLGPGQAHPALYGRVGDYILLARDDYAFTTTLPGKEADFNVANHGGMSSTEMNIPLYLLTL